MKMKMFLIAGFAILTACGDYGNGERIGQVINLTKQGVFCNTWEGEILRGNINGGSGAFGGDFHFTIEDPALVAKVQDALDKQYEVKIRYHGEMYTWCRSDSTNVFLTGIQPLAAAARPVVTQSAQDAEQAEKKRKIDELKKELRGLEEGVR